MKNTDICVSLPSPCKLSQKRSNFLKEEEQFFSHKQMLSSTLFSEERAVIRVIPRRGLSGSTLKVALARKGRGRRKSLVLCVLVQQARKGENKEVPGPSLNQLVVALSVSFDREAIRLLNVSTLFIRHTLSSARPARKRVK